MLRVLVIPLLIFLTNRSEAIDSAQFTLTPAASGRQLVRVSMPWPKDVKGNELLRMSAREMTESQTPRLPAAGDRSLAVRVKCLSDDSETDASVRIISWYGKDSPSPFRPRRVMLTFEHTFLDRSTVVFQLVRVSVDDNASKNQASEAHPDSTEQYFGVDWPVKSKMHGQDVELTFATGQQMLCRFDAPARIVDSVEPEEVIEANAHFFWKRIYFPDPHWPRWIELRMDRLGTVVLVAHLQRVAKEDGYAPDLGWTVKGDWDGRWCFNHPLSKRHLRGKIEDSGTDMKTHRYQRCHGEDRVPMQPYAWQRVEMVITPTDAPKLPASLTSPHRVQFASEDLASLYPHWQTQHARTQPFTEIVDYHRQAIAASCVVGDDYGNVTGFNHGSPHGGSFGMNRLNHNAAIFEQAWRAGDPRLIETALNWCDNFFDQSIWWGQPKFGGTRYNNVIAQQKTPLSKDFMWRSNDSVHFCTKGYDSFWLAWEETGDPRMRFALDSQVKYAADDIHCDRGECRNVGDVRDFVRLYRMSGERRYLDEALRLFRELRSKLSTGHLFDQGGKPLDPHPPFIDDDARGLTVGYAKPYIIGYALAGLPELLAVAPNEPDMKETIRAVADFLAETVDPAGGWRYPHPRSSLTLCSFGPEHAWHLCQACRSLGPEPKWLDAIEIVLRARILGWKKTGKILSSVEGWEFSKGRAKNRLELQELYAHPEDRPFQRDWEEGRVSHGSASPEGVVYFEEVLDYYLQHRPYDRLTANPLPEEPLTRVLNRM